jgi:hypothetical protein
MFRPKEQIVALLSHIVEVVPHQAYSRGLGH